MTDIRSSPLIVECPKNVLARAKTRNTTKVIGRRAMSDDASTTASTFFMLDGNKIFEATIDKTPSCSCTGKIRPCKHLCFVFLDVLRVPETSPIWWQTALLDSELKSLNVNSILKRQNDSSYGGSTKKKLRSDEDDDASNSEWEEDTEEGEEDEEDWSKGPKDDNSVISTKGLSLSTVQTLLLDAIKAHPPAVKYVNALQPGSAEGLSQHGFRLALGRIARDHADVAEKVFSHQKEANSEILEFYEDSFEASKVLHSLDRLGGGQKYRLAGNLASEVKKIVRRISNQVYTFSHEETRLNALDAVISIGHALFEVDYEVAKAMMGCGSDVINEVVDALVKIAGTMQNKEKTEMLPAIQEFSTVLQGDEDRLTALILDIEGLEGEEEEE